MIPFRILFMENQQSAVLPSGSEGLSFEKVWAMFQETDRRFREADKRSRETDRRLKEQAEEADRRFQETERLLKEQTQETDRQIRQNQKQMGDLSRKFGKIIEHMFIPNLKEKFNALGYVFETSAPNVLIESDEHRIYMELDVFLENGDCVLAVEVKTQASIDDVKEHIERMEQLRRYFDLKKDRRNIYGAVAAAVIPKNVHDFALKRGFYIITQSGDTVNLEDPKENLRAW
jgi:hypothetical protein